jgi:hypothetical protein
MNKFLKSFGKNVMVTGALAFVAVGTAVFLTVLSTLLTITFGPLVGFVSVIVIIVLFMSALFTILDISLWRKND